MFLLNIRILIFQYRTILYIFVRLCITKILPYLMATSPLIK
nr:MAG TPA: hypothetical protein [Bacteriophage sp.]